MLKFVILSFVMLNGMVLAQPSTPFTRLTTQIGGLTPSSPQLTSTPFTITSPSTTQIITPQITTPRITSPYAGYTPDALSTSTLQYPQGLNNQLNMPNIQGLNQLSFNDPFAQPTTTTSNNGALSSMLPQGLGNSINSMTSPFTTALSPNTQTSPITSTLSNLFGSSSPSTTTTIPSTTNPFGSIFTPAPQQTTSNTNSLFPIDSNNLLFPSSFSSPNQAQTPQAPSQLSTFSAQAPIFQTGNNAGPQGPQGPSQPQTPNSPFPSSSAPVPPSPSQSQSQPRPQAPAVPGSFNAAAIQPGTISMPNSPDFNTQTLPATPSLSNNSPFSGAAPSFSNTSPFVPSNPVRPQIQQQSPFQQQQPGFTQGPNPILLESGTSISRVAAPVKVSVSAPVVSSVPFPSSPFPSSSLPSP